MESNFYEKSERGAHSVNQLPGRQVAGLAMSAAKHIAPTQTPVASTRVGQSVLDCIGNTPLLRLDRVGREFANVEFSAKAEWFNPGGSVKDRPALSMIQAGLASRALRAGKTI